MSWRDDVSKCILCITELRNDKSSFFGSSFGKLRECACVFVFECVCVCV